ncbi:histone lysine N-methyltransferase trithorax [Augochlora pura]
MGRSKFPGKPPKTVTRKRIKVLGQPETVQTDSVTVAENIYYGLSLFNETFGDNEKEHPPFHGFSTKEANLSVSYIKTQQHDTEKATVKSSPDAIENSVSKSNEQATITDIKNFPSNTETNVEPLCDKIEEPIEDIKKDVTVLNSKCASKFHRPKNRRNCKNIKFSNFMKTPVLKSVNNILDQHQRTRQLRNSTAKRLLQRAKSNSNNVRNITAQCGDKPNAVRKFILPVRSAHSSRVIKPNKRFIEELEEISGVEPSENEVGMHMKKAKFTLNKICSQESKLKDGNLNKLCTKLKDKDVKNKNKKVSSNVQTVVSCAKTCEKLAASVQDAQISKANNTDVKKANVSNKNKVIKAASSESNSTQDSSQNIIRKTQNFKLNISKSQKSVSVPMKVLPDSNVPSSESSRIQTRSGTQSEVASLEVQAKFEDTAKIKETGGKGQDNSNNRAKIIEGNSDNFDTESTLSESGSEHSNHTEDEQSEWTGMKLNGGKVILRKARLKLDNKCVGGTEGPFSTTNNNNNNVAGGNTNLGLTGTIKCGVCGAVRFYRFVKQARKFGIHSCESCRKFISKMIKRQACAKSTNSTLPILQCHKGDGLCLVPPVVRSQQWNLMRCVYKARCPACLLKMCLKCYNIPSSLRMSLNALLPPMMRDPLSIPLSLSQQDNDSQGQKLISSKLGWPAEDSSEKNLFKSAMNWRNIEMGQKTSCQGTGGFLYTKLDKFDSSLNISPSKKRRKNNRIKVRKKIKNPMFSSPPISQCPQPLRQRLELKGPRVKHVCRSASVALGQPIATFPSVEGKEDTESNKHIPKTQKESDRSEKKDCAKDKEPAKHNDENITSQSTVNTTQQSNLKRGKSQQSILTSNFQTVSKSNNDTVHTVSIDFWEQYDPSEVGAKGFALIGSELFHIPAICYLCGSAGKEPLIHCQCCCEPYHAFCLEPSEWNACAQPNWCCPRCTICQSCHLRSGPKLSCIRCRQSFHHSCLSKSGVSARLYNPERPFVCQSCVKCKSCGSEGVNVHVGNLPLCSMCFKLRQQGNYCPLCQRCYNENDFDTKMMECSECSYWVHARCEGLSDERYQILSYLPDSIEFTCSQCSSNPDSVWRNAIEAELKAGFIGVIKSLSKNRKACAALKWSPRKECLCRPIPNIRKLEFSREKIDGSAIGNKEIFNSVESEESNNEKAKDTEPSSNNNSKSDTTNKTNDQPADCSNRRGLRRLRQKFHLKECSVRVKNCALKDNQDSDKKESIAQENSNSNSNDTECRCLDQQIIVKPSPTLMSVKRKVNNNEYKTLLQFHIDMGHVINSTGTKELIDAYHEILREVFPWFSPKSIKNSNGKVNNTLTPFKDDKQDDSCHTKLDDSILEIWKEEVMKAPKAIAAKTANLYNVNVEDSRSCCLCKGLGDGQETKEGRLLYCGQNEWVHSNCALWSNEVFEEIDGSLQNVHSAISRGRLIRCTECGKKGASVGCCAKNCSNTYHYPCARNIGLALNYDKTVFCSLHLNNCSHKTLQNENDFSLRRPVYVELDRKKKKYAEPSKVKVMIGSLMIDYLGTVIPEYSDTIEKIIPCDYKCSRLYWSTVNPFKIVRYYIRTYVQVYVPDISPDLENNVTIDHSKEQEKENLLNMQRNELLAVKQTLDSLIDTVCNKEVDENLAEQNNTDLLPPELKEAIFEDIPHDVLAGISMQDIMSYEDFFAVDLKNDALAMDLKNDGTFATDLFQDVMLTPEVEEIIKPPENKISKIDPSLLELGAHNDLWVHLETKTSVQDLVDDLLNSKNQKRGGRELKRSKSEVMSNSPLVVGGQRHHQRSCSLTWSCKLDSTYGPSIKRRKLSRNSSMTKSSETSVMVLDSQNERPPTLHELRIPDGIMVTVGRANTPNILSDSVRELKYCIEDASGINRRVLSTSREEGKEHKRLFWHTRQQPRILQVDGTADPSSASECSSPEYNIEEKTARVRVPEPLSIPQLDGINDESSCDSNEFSSSAEKDFNSYTKTSNNALRSKRIYGFIRSHLAKNNEKLQKNKINLFKESNLKLNLEIPQLDGADDISSDDECISPQSVECEKTNVISQCDAPLDHIDRPVTCKRCRCTYRTQDSYNRHLTHCDIMITSDSDSETMDNKLASPDSRFSPSVGSVSPQFITLSPSEGHTLSSDYPDMQATSPLEASVPSPHPAIQIEPIAQAIITPQIHTHATVETVHQTVLTSNDMIVQTQYTRTTTTLPNATVLPQESTVQITEITDPPSVTSDSSITQNIINTPVNSPDGASSQTVPSPQVSPTFSSTGVQTASNESQANVQATKLVKSKSPRAPKSRAKGVKTQIVKNNVQPHNGHPRFQPMQNNAPVIQLQQAQRASGPTVILQQVASPGIMSAYVETLQQQSGQNFQYVTTIGGQHEAAFKPQFITTNHLVPGAYIQAPSDNLLALQNGGISILPGVQIAQTQPTVLGTIIQQQPSAIQCGVISSEQLLLSSTPTLEMFTDSTGSMFLSNQPMYYGLETIVSNTVMSSSQFMTGTVPQVLASSYQTTTQVFQASKLMEPIVDVQTVPGVPTVTAVQAVQNVPGVPAVPGVPNVANVPSVPNVSNVPNIANIPNVSNVPNVPNVPTIPTIPTVPSVSNVSNIANITNIPTVSSIPTIPKVPTIPNASNIPTIRNVPSVSSVPSASTTPSTPNIPSVLGVPNVPTAPSIPGISTLPSVSNMSNIPSTPALPSTSSVPNIPTVPTIQNVSNISTLQSNLQSMGNVPNIPAVPSGYVVVNQSTPVAEPIVPPQINISATSEQNFASATCSTILPVSCQSSDPLTSMQLPDTCPSEPPIVTNVTSSPKLLQNSVPTIPRVAVRPSPVSNPTQLNNGPWKITEPLFGSEQIMNNCVRPYFDSKHVSENTSMIKSSISSKILPLPNHCITQRDIIVNKLNHDVNNVHNNYISTVPNSNNINISTSNNPVITSSTVQNKITMSTSNVPTSRPMNRVLPMQAVTPKQDTMKVTPKTEIIEEPTKPVIKPAEPEPKQELTESKKQITEDILPTEKNTETTINDINEALKLNTETIEKVKENIKLELDKDKLQNASLKIVLQKQLQDGSYKITHNMKTVAQNKKSPQVTSVEILPSKQVPPQIASLQLLPIKTFTLKANKIDEKVKPMDNKFNLLKTKTPPVAVKKPRIISKSIKSVPPNLQNTQTQKSTVKGPTLMYEIKSQDGFSHTASSMAEVWETVFQAVQNARKAHNLPPLPHNPLVENLGLENNATVYLVEQLSDVNRCTKYKPKFHNLAPPKTGDTESDLPKACDNGAARAEPFNGRKVHDMFSWLASRHRQQPKMIAISEAESRRVASTNLPMAMRFRILKETSKESVGVYHSHIHGRGLFCLRDIEAGEMVIEYAGEVIRASLTDKREKYYDSKNIGCYMFKIDDHFVVDATMKGNAARFINHSCEPNCYSRVVDILGKKHILIFALRRIIQGEELTYDYKFPFEDIKIPCTCGSRRCRKYLN